jgi:hypothetical protein
MTLTLILTLNIVLDITIVGTLAFVMLRPTKLTPHGPEALVAPIAPTPQARARRHARRTGHGAAPLRVSAALD